MHKDNVQKAFNDPNLFCSSVLLLLIDNIGTEVLTWEPESIYTELYDLFKVDVNRLLSDKINAVLSLLGTDLYHKSLEAFVAINSAMNFKHVNTSALTILGMDDILWGITECRLIEGGEEFDAQGFSHDISIYTAQLLSVEGVTKPPTILQFAEFNPTELDNRDIALASDSALAETYWSRNDEAINGMNLFVVIKLRKLFEQIKTLPLTGGENVSEKINNAIANLESPNGERIEAKS